MVKLGDFQRALDENTDRMPSRKGHQQAVATRPQDAAGSPSSASSSSSPSHHSGFNYLFQRQTVELNYALRKWFAQEDGTGPSSSSKVRVVLLDVEGTTTPLPFVTKVLYPYSVAAFPDFCSANADTLITNPSMIPTAAKSSPAVKSALDNYNFALAAHAPSTKQNDAKATLISAFVAHLIDLVNRNNKAPYLKALQGQIWKKGYVDGTIKGHLFSDVGPTIRALSKLPGVQVHIFSSGSIQAQKLLFQYSSDGDLTPYLKGYHDTVSAGPKFNAESYQKIRNQIAEQNKVPSEDVEIVFLTDIMAEVAAADSAGVRCVLSIRPLNLRLTADAIAAAPPSLLSLCSFSQLPLPAATNGASVSRTPPPVLTPSSVLFGLGLDTETYQSRSGNLKSFL